MKIFLGPQKMRKIFHRTLKQKFFCKGPIKEYSNLGSLRPMEMPLRHIFELKNNTRSQFDPAFETRCISQSVLFPLYFNTLTEEKIRNT